jgi:hypothetical protein
MNSKSVKPKTHLTLDVLLFALYLTVMCSALVEHTAVPRNSHLGFMLHFIHGISGIIMSAVIGVHLALHLPWIRSQLRKIFHGSQPSHTTTINAQPSNK